MYESLHTEGVIKASHSGTNKDYLLGIQDNGSNTAFKIDTDSGDNVALRLFNGSGAEKIRFDVGGKSFVNDVFQLGETGDLNKNVIHGNEFKRDFNDDL